MHPKLNLFFFQVSAYSFFMFFALFVMLIFSYIFARKRGFSKINIFLMLLGMSCFAFIGARIFNIAINYNLYLVEPKLMYSFSNKGFSLFGGIIFAMIAGFIIAYLRKIPLLKFADTVAPFIGIAIALMRIGCFLNGCCFGKEANLPWSVTYPTFSLAHQHQIKENFLGSLHVNPVHPTQIYELIVALFIITIALIIIKRKMIDGTACLVSAILFSAFRWLNMQWRVVPYPEEINMYFYPFLYLTTIFFCLLWLIKIYRNQFSLIKKIFIKNFNNKFK